MRRRRKDPEFLKDILGRVLPKPTATQMLRKAKRKWKETVGERIDSLTLVMSFNGGVLRIGVSSSPLLTDLRFEQDDLVEQLSTGERALVLKDIRLSLKEE